MYACQSLMSFLNFIFFMYKFRGNQFNLLVIFDFIWDPTENQGAVDSYFVLI